MVANLAGNIFGRNVNHSFKRYKSGAENGEFVLSQYKKTKRAKRNQVFSFLTAEEGESGAVQSKIQSYPLNEFPIGACGNIDSSVLTINRYEYSGFRRKHMSEVTILNADGNRYVYGIPAYNRVQKDLTFSVAAQAWSNTSPLVHYDNTDNTKDNTKGRDNFYSKETMPPYSHSFLLTAVLSPDYVDLTGDGVSADDLGTAVKINYTRLYGRTKQGVIRGKNQSYNWRMPYGKNMANYQQGFKRDDQDDKGNYVYGEKDYWVMNSIESKTMVAKFNVSDREDALGVIDENGGKNLSAKLKKLDRIDLYAKSDLLQYGSSATPLKTVHFVYSYNLCPNVENNSEASIDLNGQVTANSSLNVNKLKGKLTLEKIYFTYQRNTKGRLNPYVFNYDLNNNPEYNKQHYDRWGNYKSNSSLHINASEAEFPYTPQNKDTADRYATAWSLKSIELPTGGKITVNQEADDYAYVQDKRAMQLFEVDGFGNSSNYNSRSSYLYTTNQPEFKDSTKHNRYMFVRVPATSGALTTAEIKQKYLQDVVQMYFRCAVKMYPEDDPNSAEFVPGYCRIDDYGPCPGNNGIIWIKLKGETLGNNGPEVANPITKAAWQFLRLNLPFLAYPGSQTNEGGFLSIIKGLIAPLFDVQNIFLGFSRACMTRGWCREIVVGKSWVRLNSPEFKKYGGGARVKSLIMSDSWDKMVAGDVKADYGQVYDYTILATDNKTVISSGVAEYEPMLGQDENPFRQPLIYKQKTKLAPHSQFYMEYPIGESVYPSGGVGYRQVKVMSYGSTLADADKRTGYTLHKYYTAYDFPVISSNTPMQQKLDRTPAIFQILHMPKVEHFTGSQGFQVEINDMHGKPRSEEVYDNSGGIISATTYNYKVDNNQAVYKHLNNEVKVLSPDGTIKSASIGKDVEFMTDNRHQKTKAFTGGMLMQVDLESQPPIALPIPAFFPALGYEETQFRSFSTNKIIRRFGILESVVAQQYGSTVTTKNIVFDGETGEVLLTETQNEFNDPVFNFTYPAHLAYDGMGPAYKNIGAIFNDVTIYRGKITSPVSIEQYFTAGDEVLIGQRWGTFDKAWVIDPHHTDSLQPHQIIFIRANGKPVSRPNSRVKIIRSGRRNLASSPIASLVSLGTPFINDTIKPAVTAKIINTSVTEFKDEWKINCEKITTADCDVCKKPDCSCIYNLLKFISDHHYWQATVEDNIFINQCCFDSCFYSNGQLSTISANGCSRQIYAVPGQDTMADNYSMVVGRCTLTVFRNKLNLSSANRGISTIRVMKPSDLVYIDSACYTACGYYGETDRYPLQSIVSHLEAPVSYYATLRCAQKCQQICVDLGMDSIINPYRYGLLGNWRPHKQWVYRGFRSPDSINITGATNIRQDGIFKTYDPFWVYDTSSKFFTKNSTFSDKYINATTIAKYNSKGAEIENRNAAGIYSAALYGYLESQATAVAQNARFKNIAFDGFEDYKYSEDCSTPCRTDHFSFREGLYSSASGGLDSVQTHSGNYSLKVKGSGPGQVTISRDLKDDLDGSGVLFDADSSVYYLKKEGCLPKFSPDSGRYFVSAWVKEAQNCNALQYNNAQLHIGFIGSATSFNLTPSGNIIEGWQRIEGTVLVPNGAAQITVSLIALNGVDVNFDDVRIQPFNSSMKCYAYDERSLRLMAQLDENNYATFYEYDDQGGLIRVKKETERGVMTIQENRSVLKKK